MPSKNIRLLFALFALSGFTGLIYESVWSHYLKLFLGAAAFAQSFVLAAFMGGMALGAWLASRWSARLKNLLAAYGWIEAFIGLAALLFHEVYALLIGASLDHIIPGLGSPLAVEIYKYALCALLIVPQTVLLGMTFPLMSGAVIRRGPEASGHHLGMLYFTNSIGAAIGALAAAFWLLGWLGMPGTMRLAGAANLALAAVVLAIAHRGEPTPLSIAPAGGGTAPGAPVVRLFLLAAFVTGAASFIYEIAWIRMLSLVLGSSFQAFELMLSAFVAGLALGGYWIRRRIDSIVDPLRFAGLVQLVMGLAALATIFVYHETFDWMAWALRVLQHGEAAYPVFNLFSHAIAFAVMLPATFLAGMTLPLFTHALLRGHGERAIGQVYAANTLGAIAGVLLAVHLLVPNMGIKLTLVLGAAADIMLGAWLLRYSQAAFRRAYSFAVVIVGMIAATATARANVLESDRLASGVYRYGRTVIENSKVFFYRDGKTASVAMRRTGSTVTIITNGKPDASINIDPASPPNADEYTMTLLGALPLLIKPDARTFANIGWGSGLTAEVLLSHSGPREVDTIEIEPLMVAAAYSFSPRVSRPYRDPRSQVFFEDAKSYFARHGKRYDVIVSEPSNPWVNGVANLFTTEFYRNTKRYLAPEGVFVQWLHLYESDDRLLGSILAALGGNFADYEVYETTPSDIVVVAVAEGRVPRPGRLPVKEAAFMEQLKRIGTTRVEEVAARSLGTKHMLAPLFALRQSPVNSDFYPFVQLDAPRTRFTKDSAHAVIDLTEAVLPVSEMIGNPPPAYLQEPVPAFVPSASLRTQSVAQEFARRLLDRSVDPLSYDDPAVSASLLTLRDPRALRGARPSNAAFRQLHFAAELTLAHLAPELRRALWIERKWLVSAPRELSPRMRERFELYAAIAAQDAPAMRERALALLAQGPAEGGEGWGRFLLLTAMLGAHAMGDRQETRRLLSTYGEALYPPGAIPLYMSYIASLR